MFGNYATGGAINFHMRPGRTIQGIEIGSDTGSFNYFNEYSVFGGKGDNTEITGLVSHVRGDGFQLHEQFELCQVPDHYERPFLERRIGVKRRCAKKAVQCNCDRIAACPEATPVGSAPDNVVRPSRAREGGRARRVKEDRPPAELVRCPVPRRVGWPARHDRYRKSPSPGVFAT